jgi:hypothetical protein
MDYNKISNICFDDIDHRDYPDYCDVQIVSAEYDGVEMDEDQLEELNDDRGFVYDQLIKYLY